MNVINKNITNNENFHFSPADHDNNLKEIINLDNKKASRMYQICVVLF